VEPRIVQIIPAPPGFRAVFAYNVGHVVAPVPCLALVEEANEDGERVSWFPTFAGLLLPGEPDAEAEAMVRAWRERRKGRAAS